MIHQTHFEHPQPALMGAETTPLCIQSLGSPWGLKADCETGTRPNYKTQNLQRYDELISPKTVEILKWNVVRNVPTICNTENLFSFSWYVDLRRLLCVTCNAAFNIY